MFGSSLKKPQMSLLEKFDGMRSKFRGFINLVRLIIHLFLDERTQVGLIGTLLLGTTLAWFAFLLER
jgi:hypothetical protein